VSARGAAGGSAGARGRPEGVGQSSMDRLEVEVALGHQCRDGVGARGTDSAREILEVTARKRVSPGSALIEPAFQTRQTQPNQPGLSADSVIVVDPKIWFMGGEQICDVVKRFIRRLFGFCLYLVRRENEF
jgi:hypothetical protein